MKEKSKLSSPPSLITYAGAVKAIADGLYPDIEKFISYLPKPEKNNTQSNPTSQKPDTQSND